VGDDAAEYLTPEALARVVIDRMLFASGWIIQNRSDVNLYAGRGIAVREYLLKDSLEVDYLLFVDRRAVGALEAKPEGYTLTGVEIQSAKYAGKIPDDLDVPYRPLPFLYESTGVETQFTNNLDPEPRSREIFAVHRPETIAIWLEAAEASSGTSNRRPRGLPRRRPATVVDPDGHGVGKDLHRGQCVVASRASRRRQARAVPSR